jgi:hypothetical protein
VTQDRGKAFDDVPWADVFFATVHPSSILRGPPEEREQGLALLIADLKKVAQHPAFSGGKTRQVARSSRLLGSRVRVSAGSH